MAFFSKRKIDPEAVVKDKYGTQVQNLDAPIDHVRFLRREIDKNAGGLVIQERMFYDDGASGEDEFRRIITPEDGDSVQDSTTTIFLWIKQ